MLLLSRARLCNFEFISDVKDHDVALVMAMFSYQFLSVRVSVVPAGNNYSPLFNENPLAPPMAGGACMEGCAINTANVN